MKDSERIRLLNRMLASGTPFCHDICADAAFGINAAIAESNDNIDPRKFAQNILRLYDPNAAIEVIDVRGSPFDPLFAIPAISEAVRRISGYKRAVLVIYGLGEGDKNSRKMRKLHTEDVDFIEDYVMRYAQSFSNLEILFV